MSNLLCVMGVEVYADPFKELIDVELEDFEVFVHPIKENLLIIGCSHECQDYHETLADFLTYVSAHLKTVYELWGILGAGEKEPKFMVGKQKES